MFCGTVIPNPYPGSMMIRASGIPAATAAAIRSRRYTAVAASTSGASERSFQSMTTTGTPARATSGAIPGSRRPDTSFTIAAPASKAAAATLNYGQFINAVMKFLIIAWVVFLMVKGVQRLMALRHQEGFSYKQIAEIAQIPPGTVMSRLARARAKLKEYLAARIGKEI